MTADAEPFEVLMVCTGNICRSPQAAALLRKHLHAAEEPIAQQIRITSAGTHAQLGTPMDPQAAELAAVYGAVDSGHRGRPLTAEMVRHNDLVLCMTRKHRAVAVRLVPGASRRVFLLSEFVALIEDLAKDVRPVTAGGDSVAQQFAPPPGPLSALAPDRLRRGVDAAADRRGLVPKTSGVREDILDPYRRDPEVYRESIAQIDQAIQRLHQALWRITQGAP